MSRLIRVELSVTVDSDADADRARALFREARAESLMRFHRGDRPAIAITADTIDRFLLWKEPSSGCGADTIRRMRVRLVSFADFFGGRSLSLITADDMAAWYRAVVSRRGNARRYNRDRAGLSPETVQKYLQSLRQFCSWARDVVHGAPADLPCERFRIRSSGKIKGNRYPPKALTYQEMRRVMQLLDRSYPHLCAVIAAMLLIGARPVQLFSLRWSDVRKATAGRPGRIDLAICKGAPERSIPFTAESEIQQMLSYAAGIFSTLRGRKPRRDDYVFVPAHRRSRGGWTTSVFDHRLRQVADKLHIKDFVAYDARHTLCTLLQQSAAAAATVQAVMGHTKITTQEAYSHRTGADAIEGLSLAGGFVSGMGLFSTPEIVGAVDADKQSDLPTGLRLI